MSVDGGESGGGMDYIYGASVAPRRYKDSGHVTVVGTSDCESGFSLGLEIKSGVEVVGAQLSEIPAQYERDVERSCEVGKCVGSHDAAIRYDKCRCNIS